MKNVAQKISELIWYVFAISILVLAIVATILVTAICLPFYLPQIAWEHFKSKKNEKKPFFCYDPRGLDGN